jgi:hypothetical protein
MSEPRIVGTSAIITITVYSRNSRPGAVYYQTLRLTLFPQADSWRVGQVEALGIS